ncbi:MAG: MBL fold metallo-hydrolase [Chromatiales bacterium]|nr:MBL fold metallo-hydrolase [Chromatiales bacterium]
MLRKIVLLAVLLASSQIHAAAGVDDYAMKAQKVADGVWAIISPAISFPDPSNKGWNSNTAIVETSEGLLVFDTGSSETIGKALIKAIRAVSDRPIKWVINSHSHGDHWLGNGAFVAEKPAEMIASDVAIGEMKKGGADWVDRFHSMTDGATGRFTPVAAKQAVTKRMSRSFGGVEVEILFSGNSHSPGDIVFWLPQKSVLLTGDTMYIERAPATFDSNARQWIAFLDEMAALKPKVVIPGHGPVAGVASITRLHDYLNTLWELIAAGFAEGKADFEMAPAIKEQMKEKFEKDFPNIDDRLGQSISQLYLQVEAADFE